MLLGRLVFVYRNGHGFTKPIPGIVVAEREGGFCDVNVFNSALSHDPPMLALANVKFCDENKHAIVAADDEDVEDICVPYDPAFPEAVPSLVASPAPTAPSQEKPAKKPNKKA